MNVLPAHKLSSLIAANETADVSLRRRALLTLCLCGVVTQHGCYYDKRFRIAWAEEVKLQDGSVIVVQLEHSYERVEPSWTKYGGLSTPRDTVMTFAPPRRAAVRQEFKGFSPIFLDHENDVWYAVIEGGYYYGSRSLPGQDWGRRDSPEAQWAIKLVDDKWTPIPMAELPDKFQRSNMIPLNVAAAEFAGFDGRTITLVEKARWQALHPPSPGQRRLERPLAPRPNPPKLNEFQR